MIQSLSQIKFMNNTQKNDKKKIPVDDLLIVHILTDTLKFESIHLKI